MIAFVLCACALAVGMIAAITGLSDVRREHKNMKLGVGGVGIILGILGMVVAGADHFYVGLIIAMISHALLGFAVVMLWYIERLPEPVTEIVNIPQPPPPPPPPPTGEEIDKRIDELLKRNRDNRG